MKEIWKDIIEFNSEYQISNFGRIRSKEAVIIRSNGRPHKRISKILKTAVSKKYKYPRGAVCVNKKMKPYKIHRLVARYFVANPYGKPEVNHIDGNPQNNHYTNLEWVTRQENIKHCIDNNLQTAFKGEEVGTSILKEDQVKQIRKEFKPRIVTRSFLAQKYNVSEATIKDIIYRRTWRHV